MCGSCVTTVVLHSARNKSVLVEFRKFVAVASKNFLKPNHKMFLFPEICTTWLPNGRPLVSVRFHTGIGMRIPIKITSGPR